MKFKCEINMDNAAFENIPEVVLSDMLKELAERIERGGSGSLEGKIRDINGNTVGSFDIEL